SFTRKFWSGRTSVTIPSISIDPCFAMWLLLTGMARRTETGPRRRRTRRGPGAGLARVCSMIVAPRKDNGLWTARPAALGNYAGTGLAPGEAPQNRRRTVPPQQEDPRDEPIGTARRSRRA